MHCLRWCLRGAPAKVKWWQGWWKSDSILKNMTTNVNWVIPLPFPMLWKTYANQLDLILSPWVSMRIHSIIKSLYETVSSCCPEQCGRFLWLQITIFFMFYKSVNWTLYFDLYLYITANVISTLWRLWSAQFWVQCSGWKGGGSNLSASAQKEVFLLKMCW